MTGLPKYVLASSAILLGVAMGPLASAWAADAAGSDAGNRLADQAAVLFETPLDGFETTELAGVRFAPGPISTDPLSADSRQDNLGVGADSGFLYFHESIDAEEDQPELTLNFGAAQNAPFTPRFGKLHDGMSSGIESFLTPGEAWLLSTFTPRYADAHISLTYGRNDEESARKALGIELSSSLRMRQVNMPGVAASPSLAEALSRQQYKVGLNIGYLGFSLGASLRSEMGEFNDGFNNGFKGYDVGLSYRGSSWSTSLSVGEYSRRNSHLFAATQDLEKTYYAFELGASYSLSRAFSLTGGFRHFEYGRGNFLEDQETPRSQIFYLGTRLSF